MDIAGSTLAREFTAAADVTAAMRPTSAELRSARRRLHRKAMWIGLLVATSYWALVFTRHAVVVTVLAALALAVGLVGVATSVFHDGNHMSFSTSHAVNRMAGYTGDLLGASSWIWRFKHNHLHHGNTNVVGIDADIDQAPFARLTPTQPWRAWHRYQHVYMWVLYGFLTIQWFLFSDFIDLHQRGVGGHRFPRPPRRRELAALAAGKVLHFGWALALPMLYHRWWTVLVVYVAVSWTVGLLLATTFQLAHCTAVVDFPSADAPRRGPAFVEHQLRTTADIRNGVNPGTRAMHWLMGGLDQQVEHHLAPRLPHTAYPLVGPRLDEACQRDNLMVRRHAGTLRAIRAHGAWLRAMGRRPAR